MKRDLELIRQILKSVEDNPDPQAWIDPEPEGYSPDEVSYHIMLMDQANLLEGWNRSAIGIFRWSARNLTWHGHEILAASRNPAAWAQAKSKVDEVAPGLVFEIFTETLLREMRKAVRDQ